MWNRYLHFHPQVLQFTFRYCTDLTSDLHEYLGGPTFAPVKPHPVTKETLPVTFGHEFSGTVLEVGKGVTAFKPGQHVSIQPTIYDGTCGACKHNFENVCYNGGFVGLSGWGGGLSDAVTVPASYCLPLPDNIALDVAALVEPLAVGWHAVGQSPLKQDDNILILGGGPIGIAVIQALRARGCGQIIVSELSASRQRFAKQFGADTILDPRKVDVVKEVQNLTGGEGVDIVFDCAGVAVGLEAACKAIRVKGTVVNVAIVSHPISFRCVRHSGEKKVWNFRGHSPEWNVAGTWEQSANFFKVGKSRSISAQRSSVPRREICRMLRLRPTRFQRCYSSHFIR